MINRQILELGKRQHPNIADRLREEDGEVTFNGMKFAFADSSRVMPFRTHERLGAHPKGTPEHSQSLVNDIADDLRSGVGLNNPLVLGYNVPKSAAWLDEGHHRLEAAHKTGLLVPVVSQRSESVPSASPGESLGARRIAVPRDLKPDQFGWSPSTFDPSKIIGS